MFDKLKLHIQSHAHDYGLLVCLLLPYYFGLACMAPSITIEGDSGEIATGVYGFGIIHSPGFPSYMVAAKLFATLLFFIDTAQATNLFSMLSMVASCGTFYLILRYFLLPVIPAVAIAGLAVFGYEFWYQSMITEVYSFAVLICLLTILATIRITKENLSQNLIVVTFLWGFSIGTHVYSWVLTPLLMLLVYRQVKLWKATLSLSQWLLPFVCGLLPYLYIPLRAGKFLPIDLGHIDSLSRFINHITWDLQRSRQLDGIKQSIPTEKLFEFKLNQLIYFSKQLSVQWSWLFLLILTLTFLPTLSKRILDHLGLNFHETPAENFWRRFFGYSALLMFGIIWLIFSGKTYSVSTMGENQVHLMIVYTMAILCLGLTLSAVYRSQKFNAFFPHQILTTVLIIALSSQIYQVSTQANLSENLMAEQHARALLEKLEPNSILLGHGDSDLMPTIYMQAVRKLRPDVRVVNVGLNNLWAFDSLKKQFPELSWPSRLTERLIPSLIELNYQQRAIYASNNLIALQLTADSNFIKQFKLLPIHGVYKVYESPERYLNEIAKAETPILFPLPPLKILRAREIDVIAQYSDFHLRLAEQFKALGKTELSQAEAQKGLAYPAGPTPFAQIIQRELKKLL